MPPSANSTMMPIMNKVKFNKRGKPYASGRFVKTGEYRDYETACTHWALSYRTALEKLKADIILRRQALAKENKSITFKVEFWAVFPKDRLFTVNNKLEKIDSDNRLKPAKDLLFKILCIDDKHVFRDEIEKITGDREQMIVRITEMEPRSEAQIKNVLGF